MSQAASKILGRADILAATADLVTQTVEVPEWGGSVIVRSMTGADRDAFEATLIVEVDGKRKVDSTNMRAKLVAMTVVDENGLRLFGPDDIAALNARSAAALERVVKVAQALNGMGAEAVAAAEKNSEAAPSGDSAFA